MFAYLSKKITIPNNPNITVLEWSTTHGYLACGGDNGMLKVLKFEANNPDSRQENLSPNNISMNQTLEGHSGRIRLIAWNDTFEKLTTADESGIIIVWMLYKGSWYEEMINNRNKSNVRGLKWDKEGRRICIAYEDGAVIVGCVDGSRLWCKELKCSDLICAEWAPNGRCLLFGLASGEIHVYDSIGIFLKRLSIYCLSDVHGAVALVDINWFKHDKATHDPDNPSLAICFDIGRCQIMRSEDDAAPILLDTGLMISCCAWNDSGTILAICGRQKFASDYESQAPGDIGVAQFYNAMGDHLHSLTIPGKAPTVCTWEGNGSLRLALAIDSHIYLVSLRLKYDWVYLPPVHCLVYAFSRNDSPEKFLMFWNVRRGTTHIRSIKSVLGVCGDGDYCSVMSKADSINKPYHITIYNGRGCVVDTVETVVEPKSSVMIGNYVLVANASLIFLWQFKNPKTLAGLGSIAKMRNKDREGIQRMCHIDHKDGSLAVKSTESTSKEAVFGKLQSADPTTNPIVALAAANGDTRCLLVARSNGDVVRYRLPELWPEVSVHAIDKMPVRIEVNCDATIFGLIDETGVLTLHQVPESPDDEKSQTACQESISLEEFTQRDVWDLRFATDEPGTFAVMEKMKLKIFRGTEAEQVTQSSVYLAWFSELEVMGVQLDEIMTHTDTPTIDSLSTYPTKMLADCRSLLEQKQFEKAKSCIEENPHPRLWKVYAEAALSEAKLDEAEIGYVMCQNYQGISFIKRLRNIHSDSIRKAEIRAFFGDFEGAERMHIADDRCDLAIDLRRCLGDWFRVAQLTKESGAVVKDSELTAVWNAIGDHYFDRGQWSQACEFYRQGGAFEKLAQCLFRMENFVALENLINELPEAHDLLKELARIFAQFSLSKPAVKALLKCSQLKEAVNLCMDLNDWSLAFQLTESAPTQTVSSTETGDEDAVLKVTLRQRVVSRLRALVTSLIKESRCVEAAEVLRTAAYYLDAAKLLFQEVKRAQKAGAALLKVKKLYVMIALLIDKHHEQSSAEQKSIFTTEEGDVRGGNLFADECSLMEQARERNTTATAMENASKTHTSAASLLAQLNSAEMARLVDQPWRGAEAYHFLMLAQRLLYAGAYERAMRTALVLRDYDDFVEARKIYSLLALCSLKSGAFGTASKAFMKLQNLPDWSKGDCQALDDLTYEIFSVHPPKNVVKSSTSIELDMMLESDSKVPICVVTGQPVTDYQFWMCPTCKHSAYENEITHKQNCPMCHARVL